MSTGVRIGSDFLHVKQIDQVAIVASTRYMIKTTDQTEAVHTWHQLVPLLVFTSVDIVLLIK